MTSHLRLLAAGSIALLAFSAGTVLAAPAPTPDDPGALLDSVKQAPNAKIGPWLDGLYAEYRQARGKGVTDQQFRSSNRALRVSNGMVSIDAMATDGAALARSLRAMGATNVSAKGPLVSARVPVDALGRLAADAALVYARP